MISNLFIYVTNSYSPISDKYQYSVTKLGGDLNQNFGEITSDILINQSFVAKYNNLVGIEIFVSTFNRENIGETFLEISHGNRQEKIRSNVLDNSKLKDNQYTEIKFPPVTDSKNRVFSINISSKASENNGVTFWKDNKIYNNTSLIVNNKNVPGTLVANLIYENIIDLKTRVIINAVVLLLNFLTLRLFKFLRKR